MGSAGGRWLAPRVLCQAQQPLGLSAAGLDELFGGGSCCTMVIAAIAGIARKRAGAGTCGRHRA